jgi:TP901 family phage tail tape measure protein
MAEIEIGNLVARISLDDTGINKSMAELNRAMKVAQSEFQAAGAKLGDFAKSTEGLKVKAESLAKQIDVQQQIVAKLRAEHAKAAEEKGKDAKETQNLEVRLNKAAAELFKLQNALKETNAEIARQSSAWTKIGDALKPVGEKLQSVGQTMKDAGKTLSVAVTAPITAMGVSIIKTGMEFEAAMSKVAAISGATGEDLKAMTEQAKELGATTVFSASQAASGMEFLARAGWNAQEIMAAMPGMLDLAAAGALDLGEAADITSNIMSAFSIEASKAGKVADILAMATSNANTDVQQLGQAMTYLAPTAATMGQSIEQATAAVMIMSDAGIQGEKAGAAFATSLQRLAKPTKEMENTMRQLGVTFFDSQGKMKPFTQIVAELEQAMAGYTNKQKAAALSTIFGAEAYKNWAVLIETGSEALARNVEMLENADGAAKKMAQTMTDNTKGAWVAFQSAVEGLAIALSDHLLPIFTQIVEKLTEWVRWFGELDPATQKVTMAIAAIAAAIGPALVIFGTLIQSVGSIASAFGAVSLAIAEAGGIMSLLTGPVGIAIGALGLLVAAGVAVYQNWDTIKTYAIQVWDSIKGYVLPVVDEISSFITETFGDLAAWWKSIWPDLQVAFTNIWNGILEYTRPTLEAIKAVFDAVWPYIKNITVAVWEAIKGVITAAINAIKGSMEIFIGLFTGDWDRMWNGIKMSAQAGWDAITSIFSSAIQVILNVAGGLVSGIAAYFGEIGKQMAGFGSDIVKGLGQGIQSMATWVKEKVLSLVTMISNTIKEFFGIHSPSRLMAEYGRYIVEGLWEGIKSMASWIKSNVTQFASNISNTIKEFFGIHSPSRLMAEYGQYIAEGLAIGIEQNKGKPIQQADLMVQAINGALGKLQNELKLTAQIAQAEFDLMAAKMQESGSESEMLKAKYELLTQQLDIQNQTVAVLRKAYEDMKATKGENAEETKKLYLELLKEQTAYAELNNQLKELEKNYQAATRAAQQLIFEQGRIFENINGKWVQVGGKGYADSGEPYNPPGIPDWLDTSNNGGGAGEKKDSGRTRPKDTDKEGAYQKDVDKDNFAGSVNTNVRKAAKEVGDSIKEVFDKVKDAFRFPGLATGGTVTKSGWTWVGENGPELLHLPRGSQVIPNYDLPRLGGQAIDYEALARAMARYMKPSITQYNTFHSPQPLSPSETARKNLQVSRQLALEWGM